MPFSPWPAAFTHWARSLAAFALLVALTAFPALVAAERLPFQRFTAADGLAHDRVQRIVRDSRGFLWFCTAGGLSRFDGRRFASYSAEDGLPVQTLTDLLENTDGSYWLATNGAGVVRYVPAPRGEDGSTDARTRQRFTQFGIGPEPAANRINKLFRDRSGRLWIATDGGLFVAERENDVSAFRQVQIAHPLRADRMLQVWSIVEDSDGSLWIGTSVGLVRRLVDGRTINYRVRPGQASDHVWALLIDAEKRLWIGHDTGLLALHRIPPADADVTLDNAGVWHTASDGLAKGRIQALLQATDGRIWIATDAGLSEIAGERIRKYEAAQGVEGGSFRGLEQDSYGNIWMGTAASGAMRLARDGFTTYTRADGLNEEAVAGIFETPSGHLGAVTRGPRISMFDGHRFRTVAPNLSQPVEDESRRSSSATYGTILIDRLGEWWISSGDLLFRFRAVTDVSRLATISPLAVYTPVGGRQQIWRLFEDSRGDLWIAPRVPTPEALIRWERSTGTFHRYTDRDGLPASAAHTFAQDRAGNVWIAFRDSGVARYRHGDFRLFPSADGVPLRGVTTVHLDHRGQLWCGTAQGLVRIDDPNADHPHLVRHSPQNSLADNVITSLSEDLSGRLYVGTRRGIDRLDATTGAIRHYSLADGLAALETNDAYRDRHGALWYGTAGGLSRLVPDPESQKTAPKAIIGSVRIDGVSQPLSDLGEAAVGPLKTPSPRSGIEIGFFALSFAPGRPMNFQYRMEGIEAWSPPTEQQTVLYPRLAPGTYRFLVRAASSDGVATETTPASVTLTIPRPVWARWWFLATAAAGIILAVHAAYRYRLGQLLEIERIRTRLAMDLHDDIGSALSQVAEMSAVAKQRAGGQQGLAELLERIAERSRQVIDTMSDVVWAINPERDSLRDLAQRMRRFTAETLEGQDIELQLELPPESVDVRLGAEVRREVFLIFKEGINNLVRHAKCSRATVGLRVEGASLVLTIRDDGVGFDPAAPSDGLGLRSMRERAGRLGAELDLSSTPNGGTQMRLIVPLRGARQRAVQTSRNDVGASER